jgi:hypothetical protein
MGRTACTEPQCLYSIAIPLLPLWAVRPVQSLSACTVQLYLYSPYGPYGLYRASVPVQGRTLPFFYHSEISRILNAHHSVRTFSELRLVRRTNRGAALHAILLWSPLTCSF